MESLQVDSFKGNGQGFLCLLLLVLHGCIVFVQSSDEVSSPPSPKEMLKTSIPWEILSGHYLPSSRLAISDVPITSFAPPRSTLKSRSGGHNVSSSDGDRVLKTPQQGEEPKPVHNVTKQGEELETVITVTSKGSDSEPVFTVTRQEDKSQQTLTGQEDQAELVLTVTRQEDKSEQTLTRQKDQSEPTVTWQQAAFNITRQKNEPEQTFNVHRQEDEPELELTDTRPHQPVPDSNVRFTSPRNGGKTTSGFSIHDDITSIYSEHNETTTASAHNQVTSATQSPENISLAGSLQSQVGRITFKLEETTHLLSMQDDRRSLAQRYEEAALVSSTTHSITTSDSLDGRLASHTATLQKDKVLTLSKDVTISTYSQPNDDDTSKETSLASVPDEGGLLKMLVRNVTRDTDRLSPTPSLTIQLAKDVQVMNDSSKIETMVEKIADFNDTKDDKLLSSKKKVTTSSGRDKDDTPLTENPPPSRSFTVTLKHTTYDLSTGSSIHPLKKNRNLKKVAKRLDDVVLEKETDVYPFLRSPETTKSNGLFSSLSGSDRTETKKVTSLSENSEESNEVSRKVGILSASPMNRSVEGGSVSLVVDDVTSASSVLPEISEETVLVETAELKELEEWKLTNSGDIFPTTSGNQSETTATGAAHDTDHLDAQSLKDTRVLKTTTVSMEDNHNVNTKEDQMAGDEGDGMADRRTDSGCLYDVYGRFGTLRLPQTEQYMGYAVGDLVTCRWRIQIPSGPNIKISFEKLSLALGVEYLEIVVGMDGELRRRRISGSKLPKDIITMGTKLWMTLRVRNDNIEDKVILKFEESEAAAMFPETSNYTCGAINTDMTGSIASPGYPHTNYSNLQECSWYLIAPPHSVIRLKVEQFSTDDYDQVTIGRGLHAADVSSQLFNLYGHRQDEEVLVIPVNTLWIHFETDDSDTDTGFLISFETVPRDICNTSNIMTSLEGTVTSVGYPGPYPINSECTWYIRGPEKARIILTFHDLSVHEGRDFVLVGEGRNVFDGPFRTFTGQHTDTDGDVDMEASDVWIHFTSDHTEDDPPSKGFNMSYRIIFPEHLSKNVSDMHYPEEEAAYTPGGSLEKEEEVHTITVLLTDVGVEQLEKQKEKFEDKVAEILNRRCGDLHDSLCPPGRQIRSDDVRVVSSRQQQQHQLLVLLSVTTDGDLSAAVMAASDYEELETLFHTDLQSLDLQNEDSEEATAAHLPEWLIGVIVVVILLIIAFFAMVIYSLMKERKKSRAGSYGGTTTSASICEDVEVGKSDGAIRITAFSLEQDKDSGVGNGHTKNGSNGTGWTLDSEAAATLQRREPGVSGCMNPAFIDDDDDEDNADKDNAKCENEKDKESGKTKASKKNKEAKHQKGSSKTSKSPKSPKTPKSPKGSKSPKSAKNEKNSLKDADKSAASEKAPEESCKENGNVSKGVEDAVSAVQGEDHETTDIGETPAQADCHKEESQDTAVQEEKTSAGPDGEAVAESSDEAAEKGKVEVVVDHELPPRDLQDGLVLHIENSGESGDRETSPESSTDDKENHSDVSTNL